MKIGKRIIYDKGSGSVLNGTFEEMEGDLQKGLRPAEIDYIDLPFGYNDNQFKNAAKYHVDITKSRYTTELKDLIVIDIYYQQQETEEERLQREKTELADQLLLLENEKIGGGIL